MTAERRLLFALIRQTFDDPHEQGVLDICRRSAIDWQLVVSMAAAEGVAPVVSANLESRAPLASLVPDALLGRLRQALFENVAMKIERRREFTGQLMELDAHGYDVLLLKSAALEETGVYRHSWVTCSRDLDVHARSREGEGSGAGRTLRGVLNDEYGVENGDYTGHHDLSLSGVLDLSFDEFWRAATPVHFDGAREGTIYVLCPADQLLALCLNSGRKRYFRLKPLFDIAETIRHHRDLDWERFTAAARRLRAGAIVYAALRAAQVTVGLPEEATQACQSLVGPIRARLLNLLISLTCHQSSRAGRILLQYAGFTWRQRWRDLRLTFGHTLPRSTAAQRTQSLLPGEA